MSRGRNTTGAATGKARVRKAATRKGRKRRQILNLSTVTEHLFITIDEIDYDLMTRQKLDALTQYIASEAIKDLGEPDALQKAVDAKDYVKAREIFDRITTAQNQLVMIALPSLPEELLEELDMVLRGKIIAAFLGMAPRMAPMEAESQPSPESPPTGENGSPDSSDSTDPETPAAG